MDESVTIRVARSDDADIIGMLWQHLADYHRDLNTMMPVPAVDGAERYAARVQSRLDDSYTKTLVAEVSGEVIGYVMGIIVDLLPEMFEQERAGFLADIYVRPEHRGKGIGRGLVSSLADWFRSRGIEHMEWYVASANHSGIAFWLAMGGRDVMTRMRLTLT